MSRLGSRLDSSLGSRLGARPIMMTTDTVGGVWTYATSLAAAFSEAGADVHLVTLGPPTRDHQREMLTSGVDLVETGLKLEWQDPEASDHENACRVLLQLERQIRPDIVHLNSFREAVFPWVSPVVVTAHSCVNSWGLACDDCGFLSEPRWQRYTDLVKAGINHASSWIAPTSAFGETFAKLYTPRHPGVLIWNGIEPSPMSPLFKENFVLAAGRLWDKAKNLAALAEAAEQLDCTIHVAGTGGEHVGSRPGALRMLGPLPHDELRHWMRRAAIFASPALYEPFGLSVLEAADAGCALVLSDIPTFRELWQDAALFVPARDVAALRSALCWLCGDHAAREALQYAARQRAGRYTLRRMVSATNDLYRDLLMQASSRPMTEACA